MRILRWLPLVITLSAILISVLFINVTMLPNLEREIVGILIDRSRFLVDTVYQFVYHMEKMAESGIVSESEAIEIAKNVVRSSEYGRGGYFWVITSEGVIAVHPHHSEYEGRHFQEIDDAKLRENFKNAIGAVLGALNSGKYFAEYTWYNYETGEMERKISVFKHFKPWDWIIGTGVYERDIKTLMIKEKSTIKRFLAFFVAVVLTIAFVVEHSLNRFERERERLWNEMTLERARLSTLIENLPIPVAMKDSELKYIYINSAFSSFCGKTTSEIVGKTDSEIFPEDLASCMNKFDDEILKGGSSEVYEFLKRSDDEERWFICRKIPVVSGSGNSAAGILCVLSEITGYKEEINKLKEKAGKDPLTGVLNRIALESEELKSRFTNMSFALIMLDLDGFKAINDTYGHAVGDEVLKEAARRIEKSVRKDTVVIRYGGDEFLIICPVETLEDVKSLLERILKRLKEPVRLDGITLSLSASAGISIYPLDGTEIDELINKADEALYRAKKTGKGVFKFYNQVVE